MFWLSGYSLGWILHPILLGVLAHFWWGPLDGYTLIGIGLANFVILSIIDYKTQGV